MNGATGGNSVNLLANSKEEAISIAKQLIGNSRVSGDQSPTERGLNRGLTGTITGYLTKIEATDYEATYSRTLGGQIVDKPVHDTWREWFKVETEEGTGGDQLQREIEVFNRNLTTWQAFQLADRFACLDGYSLLYFGVNDNLDPKEELGTFNEVKFLKVYRRGSVIEVKRDDNKKSSTYWDPTIFKIKVGETDRGVHASRLLIFSEDHLGDPLENSIPKLQRPYNYLQLLENLAWATGEAAFQRVVPPWHVKYDERPDNDVAEDIENQFDKFRTGGLQRISSSGVTIEPLTGSEKMVPVKDIEEILIDLIAGATNLPKRMIVGSSAGALASSETDLKDYYAGIGARQENYAEPILREFYTLLQDNNILPDGEFDLIWNPLFALTEKEQAEIWNEKAMAATQLAGIGVQILGTETIVTDILGLSPEQVAPPTAPPEAQANTDQTGQELWTQFYMNTDETQKKYENILRTFFENQMRAVLKAFRSSEFNTYQANAPATEETIKAGQKELEGIMNKLQIEAAELGIAKVATELGLGKGALDIETLAALETKAIKLAGEITDFTIEQVRAATMEGVARAEGIPKIAKRIENVFDQADKVRATRIARTEVISSSNHARLNEYKKENIEKKEWLTAQDANVRETHRIHGQVVGIDETFSNGLLHPGDFSGGSAEVINCRCAIRAVIIDKPAPVSRLRPRASSGRT